MDTVVFLSHPIGEDVTAGGMRPRSFGVRKARLRTPANADQFAAADRPAQRRLERVEAAGKDGAKRKKNSAKIEIIRCEVLKAL